MPETVKLKYDEAMDRTKRIEREQDLLDLRRQRQDGDHHSPSGNSFKVKTTKFVSKIAQYSSQFQGIEDKVYDALNESIVDDTSIFDEEANEDVIRRL